MGVSMNDFSLLGEGVRGEEKEEEEEIGVSGRRSVRRMEQ